MRVVVESVKDCYAALGSIHALWRPVQGRFKDYIAMPKFNLYQSLHTTVVGPEGKPVEVQIRTEEMHRRAEYGIAAHWGYKEQRSARPRTSSGCSGWSTGSRRPTDPAEFMQTLKIDLEQDEVFVFTPKGKVITLPTGATPVDFAYAIHTEVGHRCIGARVNGRLVPLDSALASGDTVEIFTSKVEGAGPSRDWLQFVQTPRARTKIRQWFSRERRVDAIDTGRDELVKALRKEGLPVQKLAGRRALDDGRGDACTTPTSRRSTPRSARATCRRKAVAQRRPARAARAARSSSRSPRGRPPRSNAAAPHRGRPRRGPRRRDGPALALLHAGAGRRDHGLRHPRAAASRCTAPTARTPAGSPPRPSGVIEVEWDHDQPGHLRRVGRGRGARPVAAPARRRPGARRSTT